MSGEEAVVFWAETKCISRPLSVKFFLICKENKESASWGVRKTSRLVRITQEELPDNCASDKSMLNAPAGKCTHLNSSV